jgi:glycosyltransferase involved in cell wall biosynthesis
MKKKVVLISPFVDPYADDNSRVNSIYDLIGLDAEVLIITSNFNHSNKSYYKILECSRNCLFINVPPYINNIGVKRIFSHIIFAFRLRKVLRRISPKPDLIYSTLPTSTGAMAVGLYCKKFKIKFAIDVIDLWPESFIILKKPQLLFKVLTWPWRKISEYCYENADLIFSESYEYGLHAERFNKKTHAIGVYLGTDPIKYEKLLKLSTINLNKPLNDIWLCYGGSLGLSYEFGLILKVFNQLYRRHKNIKLWFIGGGIKADSINEFAKDKNLPIEITGYLNYTDYLKYLSYCDIAFNVFKKETKVVHSYKFNDYIMAGLAIINNLRGETLQIIDKYKLGINLGDDYEDLLENIEKLLIDKKKLHQIKINSIYVSENILNKQIIYKRLIEEIID